MLLLVAVHLLLNVAVLCIVQLHVSARCCCYDCCCSYSLPTCMYAVSLSNASLLPCATVVPTNNTYHADELTFLTCAGQREVV